MLKRATKKNKKKTLSRRENKGEGGFFYFFFFAFFFFFIFFFFFFFLSPLEHCLQLFFLLIGGTANKKALRNLLVPRGSYWFFIPQSAFHNPQSLNIHRPDGRDRRHGLQLGAGQKLLGRSVDALGVEAVFPPQDLLGTVFD